MKAKLRPYQKRGVGWLTFMDGLGLGAILADDMGLGKTVQVLTLLEQERQEVGRRRVDPTLLICPMSLVANWQREAERFTPKLKVHVHHGSERLEGKEFQRRGQGRAPGRDDVRAGPARPRAARRGGLAADRDRRGAGDQERGDQAGPRRALAAAPRAGSR